LKEKISISIDAELVKWIRGAVKRKEYSSISFTVEKAIILLKTFNLLERSNAFNLDFKEVVSKLIEQISEKV